MISNYINDVNLQTIATDSTTSIVNNNDFFVCDSIPVTWTTTTKDNISIDSGSVGYSSSINFCVNDKFVFQLKNKHIEVNNKDMFLDLKNDTLIILEKDNIYNLKVYKISSLKLETEAREPVKIILNNKLNKKLLTEKSVEKNNKTCACSTYVTLTNIADISFVYNGLVCKITQNERNVYVDVKNNIAYICNGKDFLEYKIKNFEVEVYSQENLSEIKEKKEKRVLLTEKTPVIAKFSFITSGITYTDFNWENTCFGVTTGINVFDDSGQVSF